MKKILLFITLLSALTLSGGWISSASSTASATKKDRGTVIFTEPIKLMGITLKGEYLFVHDDEAMLRGERCTLVYKGRAEVRDQLVVSFHCTPVERAKAYSFTVRTQKLWPGETEIIEYQFGGSTEGHMVPTSDYAGRVPVARLDQQVASQSVGTFH